MLARQKFVPRLQHSKASRMAARMTACLLDRVILNGEQGMAPDPDAPSARVVKDTSTMPRGIGVDDEQGADGGNNYLLSRPFAKPPGTANGYLLVSRFQDSARIRMRFDSRQVGVLKHAVPPADSMFLSEAMASHARKATVANSILRELLESCLWSDYQINSENNFVNNKLRI
eukprot:2278818-Amphidinium_carterae.1